MTGGGAAPAAGGAGGGGAPPAPDLGALAAVPAASAPPRPRRYWQVAAGSAGREYSAAFLRHGLAFVGGEGYIARMAQVRPGDRVLLKAGLSRLLAVGEVVERGGRCGGVGDRPWLRDFDGWDLPAYCFVRWGLPPEPLPAAGLTRATLQEVWQPQLLDLADRVLAESPAAAPPAPEPAPTRPVEDHEILQFLVRRGLRPAAAEELTAALRRIRLLARYYYDECDWKDVREHETRTFLILPLLVALGWPEQRLKVELAAPAKGRIDVACFRRPYRRAADGRANDGDLVLILESKGFRFGLDHAPAQARGYAEHFPACVTLIVSNGFCYKAFRRDGRGAFSAAPWAYLNLLSPRDAYPLDPANVRGCFEVLEALMPPA